MHSRESELFEGVVPFVLTAEASSFGEAARRLGVTTSSVSKAIAKLEDSLGVRLLQRTSRRVAVTVEGRAFLERCREAIEHVRAGREAVLQTAQEPRGVLRISLPLPLGRALLMPALPRLLNRHPSLKIHAVLTDRFVRFEEEDVDLAVRIGKLQDSAAYARRLRQLTWVTAGAPAYLGRRGTPTLLHDLNQHNCLKFVAPNGRAQEWVFQTEGSMRTLDVRGNLTADNGEALMEPALAGLGLIQAHDYMVRGHIARGELVEVLEPYAAAGPPISVLCPKARQRSPKVRAFSAFVIETLNERLGTPPKEAR